jgi:alkylation response protein AidB-like acyl-CoA dehydrogenase
VIWLPFPAAFRRICFVNFTWEDEQRSFRSTVRTFLAANLPKEWESLAHGPGSEAQSTFSTEFCGKLAQAGLLVPHWPERWGGRDADPWSSFILAEEMWAAGEPRGGQYMNVNWIGPTLMRYGSDQQQTRYIPPMARGETIWCQGFSEPEAGSDLASLRTRAEKSGANYYVNGQKIWTSYAGRADTCFLLARTAPGKNGISIFLVPMNSPGITVRQIPSVIGEGDIHEVFFDQVEVPASALLGAEGQAWEIVRAALSLERVGIPRFAFAARMLDRAVAALKAAGRFGSAIGHAASARAACEAARLYSYQIIDQRRHGIAAGPEASVARFATVNAERLVSEFVVEHCPDALAGGDPMLLVHHQRAIVAGIASGAAEIQLNLIATDFLRLPREPR